MAGISLGYLKLLQAFRGVMGGTLNSFFAFITTIAVDHWIVVPGLIVFWAFNKKNGVYMLSALGFGKYINAVLKSVFCVYRPWIRDPEIHPLEEVMSGATGYSFPSGHASGAGSFYCSLIRIYRKYKGLCVFFGLMILITMFSRNYVGVHTPEDVLVGCLVGIGAAYLAAKVLDWVDSHPDKDWVVLAAATAITVLVLLYIRFKAYPMDYVDGQLLVDPKKMTVDGFKDPGCGYGTVLGWFIERRYIKFDTSGTPQQKLLRCLSGALLYVFIQLAVVGPLGKAVGVGIVHFLLQAVAIALFMTVYPIIFTAFEKRHK